MPRRVTDISGNRYGSLVATRLVSAGDNAMWEFQCDCGNTVVRRGTHVTSYAKKSDCRWVSCGCRQHLETHGIAKTPLYNIWVGIKRRCYDPKNHAYKNYGGRGIKMCDEWLKSPVAFADWAVANGYAAGMSTERVDVNGDYCPANCMFIPLNEQGKNTRKTRWIEYNGERKNITDWASTFGLNTQTLWKRLKDGWPVHEALTTSAVPGNNRRP